MLRIEANGYFEDVACLLCMLWVSFCVWLWLGMLKLKKSVQLLSFLQPVKVLSIATESLYIITLISLFEKMSLTCGSPEGALASVLLAILCALQLGFVWWEEWRWLKRPFALLYLSTLPSFSLGHTGISSRVIQQNVSHQFHEANRPSSEIELFYMVSLP